MAGFRLQGTNNIVEVTTNNNVQANLPTTAALAGNVVWGAVRSDGTAFPSTAARSVIRIEASERNRLRSAVDSTMLHCIFPGTHLDTGIWFQSSSTATITNSSGNVNVNANASLTSGAYAIVSSYRQFAWSLDNAVRFDCTLQFSAAPVLNTTVEFGLFQCVTTGTALDGAFFRQVGGAGSMLAVVSYGGTEQTVTVTAGLAATTRTEFSIVVDSNQALFYINGNLAATIAVASTGTTTTQVNAQPVTFRVNNTGVPGTGTTILVSSVTVTLMDFGYGRTWMSSLTGQGAFAASTPTGTVTTYGSTANIVKDTVPSAGTLSASAAGYTTLGGDFLFTVVSGAETDYNWFAFKSYAESGTAPAQCLYITGVIIDSYTFNTGNNTGGIGIQWGISVGATGLNVTTAESAGVKATRRYTLGYQFAGQSSTTPGALLVPYINTTFASPLVVNTGEYVSILLKEVTGTVLSNSQIRGTVTIIGYWE